MPLLEMMLQPGEQIYAEAGELAWISAAIQLRTAFTVGGLQGGLGAVLGRALAGGTLFMTEYSAAGAVGMVAFGAKAPGSIFPVDLQPGQVYMVHRHGFVCAQPGVQLGIGFQQRLGAGIFGGTGVMMQRVSGQGRFFVELHGETVVYDLQPGNTIRVHPGHVGMFEQSVQFDITTVPGISNLLFGGDGIFLAALTGPGRVWLQSTSLPTMAHALTHYRGG